MYPQLLDEAAVMEDAVFDQLGVFPEARGAMLSKRDHMLSLAGM